MGQIMKRLIGFLLAISMFFVIASCKKSDSSNPVNIGPGLGGVTFAINQKAGTQGGIIFTAKPSTNVTITQITVSLPAQSYQDILQGDGQTVYQGGQTYDLDEYTGVASGQQWTFKFEGKLGTAQGQAYNVTSNYTVP